MADSRLFIFTFMFLLKQTTVIESLSSAKFSFFQPPKQCFQSDYCYKSDIYRVQSKYYSTKTAYRTAYPANECSLNEFRISGGLICLLVSELFSIKTKLYNSTDCEPSKIFLLIRHGTRLPTSKDIRRFSQMEQVSDKR